MSNPRFLHRTLGIRAMSLPPRVARAVAENEASSEVLVCLVQVAAIAVFSVLYALSPKAFPDDTLIQPVPLTLSIYSIFTIGRLYLALKNRLNSTILYISVVIDMTVLMATIWSFHVQYQSPPALYLKAPTLMYVFILIALRALRFDPGLVILSGVSAVVGWGTLVTYAVVADPDIAVTRSYTTYMTSYAILLGAEFDKLVSIAMVTAILALAQTRARRLLETAASTRQAVEDLSRFFDQRIAEQIVHAGGESDLTKGTTRDTAILFVDLRGFTSLSKNLLPGDVIALLQEFHAWLLPIVVQHGGSVDKYLGDGVMVSFGAVSERHSQSADAFRALETILTANLQWATLRAAAARPVVGIGLGLAAGPTVCGTIGHNERLEWTVIGDAVNLAAKLEKHCKQEGTLALATADAYEKARAQGYRPALNHRRLPKRSIDGTAEPIDLVAFSGLPSPPGRSDA